MIQRKQSVFLLLSIISSAICMFLPIGRFVSENMGADSVFYNIAIKSMDGSMNYVVCVLFILLLIQALISLFTIFMFKKRPFQSKCCKLNMVLLVAWYAAYTYFAFTAGSEGTTFHISFCAALPLISLVFLVLANMGIRSDEELVRSMDRIR